jgi:hypothetical protein
VSEVDSAERSHWLCLFDGSPHDVENMSSIPDIIVSIYFHDDRTEKEVGQINFDFSIILCDGL